MDPAVQTVQRSFECVRSHRVSYLQFEWLPFVGIYSLDEFAPPIKIRNHLFVAVRLAHTDKAVSSGEANDRSGGHVAVTPKNFAAGVHGVQYE